MASNGARVAALILTTIACVAPTEAAPAPAPAPAPIATSATLCVGAGDRCLATIQEALDAARDGDTIVVGEGTFAGGVTIDKSVTLVGAGAAGTIIEGGGPVLTIGTPDASSPPTVSIRRVTIRGGLNDTIPEPSFVKGGGVWIPPAAGDRTGASVTISDSVITGNRVTPKTVSLQCGFPCAYAEGAGIHNSGTLTVTDTWIRDNVAGSTETDHSIASYAGGGGVTNAPMGNLVMRHSFVIGNRSEVDPPNGTDTDGAIVSYGQLIIEGSIVAFNHSVAEVSVESSFPDDSRQLANAGGLWLTEGSSTTIRGSTISRNQVISSNTAGDAVAEAGGIDTHGYLLLVNSSVEGNVVSATVPASSGFLALAHSGGIQVPAGGVPVVRDSRIVGNSVSATSETGMALALGGGITNISNSLTLERTVVMANRASATGVGGFNVGGGIANILFGGGPPDLTLIDTDIIANSLSASDDITSQGGGLYTFDADSGEPIPVVMTRTVIEGNEPDQCVGC